MDHPPGTSGYVSADHRDNGVGTGGAVPETHGIGLSNMKERVEALNGSIHIQAENGFRIFITIPKK